MPEQSQPSRISVPRRGADDKSKAVVRTPTPAGASTKPRSPRRRSRAGWIIGIIVLLLLISLVFIVMSSVKEDRLSVEVQPVTTRTIVQTVTATGMVEPETQVKISSEVSGEIVFIGVEEGERVQKGELLVRINPESFQAQIDEMQAAVSSARAREAQARAGRLSAQQDLVRIKALYDRKLATQQELDAGQAQVKIAKAEEDAGRFGVAQAQASLRRVREALSRTSIFAPISGVVIKLNSKVGEKVVGAIQMTGTEIMTVADLSVIEAVVDVSESDVVQVQLGDTARIEVDAIPGKTFRALVSRIANSPKQTGLGSQEQLTNFEVRLRFVDADPRFRPGMTAVATIETDRRSNVIGVPIQSVTTRDSIYKVSEEIEEGGIEVVDRNKVTEKKDVQPVVFVLSGGIVRTRPVTTGIRDNRYYEITSGLKPGDTVVVGSYTSITRDLADSTLVTATERKSEGSGR